MEFESSGNTKTLPVSERKVSNIKITHQMDLHAQTIQKQLVKRRHVRTFKLEHIYVTMIGLKYEDSIARKLVQAIRPSSKKLKTFGLRYGNYDGINEAESTRLSQCIKTCRSMQRFNIDLGGIVSLDDTILRPFSRVLKRLPSLKQVSFSYMHAGDLSVLGLSRFILNLRRISLQGLYINWVSNFENLAPALIAVGKSLKRASALKTLDLNYQVKEPCNDDEVLPLFEALGGRASLEKISLVLESQGITDESLSRLGNALKKQASLKDLKLDFSRCQEITGKGITNIKENLKELSGLQSLKLGLNSCEKIEEIGVVDFRKLTSLKIIDFDFQACKNLNELGVFSLGQTLKGLSSLQKIKIQLTGIEICDAEGDFQGVEHPKITDGAFLSLKEALENAQVSLQDLDLNFDT